MRTTGILFAVLFDLSYRAAGIGLAWYVGANMAERITALYSTITAAFPG